MPRSDPATPDARPTVSFMSANFVARELGYRMTEGWGQGDRATQDAFRPESTFAARFGALLDEVVALGFDAMDLWVAHLNPAWASGAQIATARALLDERGLRLASLAGPFGDTREAFEASCRAAVALGAPVLGGFTGLLDDDPATLAALLDDHGLRFGYENHPETSVEAILARLPDAPPVGACVDTGWFGTHGVDAVDAIRRLAPRLVHVHLKDVRAAGAHDTCRLGAGVVPVAGCVDALLDLGWRGAISVEHEPETSDPSEDVAASRAWLEGRLAGRG